MAPVFGGHGDSSSGYHPLIRFGEFLFGLFPIGFGGFERGSAVIHGEFDRAFQYHSAGYLGGFTGVFIRCVCCE